MHQNNKIYFILLVVMQGLICGCTHHEENQTVKAKKSSEVPFTGCGYNIVVPSGWHEVLKNEDVAKHVFWAFTNNNFTKFREDPLFRAWDAPEHENAFLTVMELKRHRNFGITAFYREIIHSLQEMGWTIQETGTTKIDNEYCKWWNQSHSKGAVQQQCYMVGNGEYMYIFTFTTAYLNEQKQKQFQQIAKTITFLEGM